MKSNETIAKEVLAGKWGSGKERKKRLKAAGYNYAAIQKIVNKLCNECGDCDNENYRTTHSGSSFCVL